MVELKLRKNGLFYDVFNEEAIILHFLFGYKIKDNRVSFPNNALTKVLNMLEEKKINYSLQTDEKLIRNNGKNDNYEKYLIKVQNKMNAFDEVRLDKLLKEFEKLVFDE